MYITQVNLIKERLKAEGSLSISEVITSLIAYHQNDPRVKFMEVAERYFNDEHDIKDVDFQQSWIYESDDDGTIQTTPTLIKNPNASNHHNTHNHYAQLIEQVKEYMIGQPAKMTVQKALRKRGVNPGGLDEKSTSALEFELSMYATDERFQQLIADIIEDMENYGVCYVHTFYDQDGELQSILLPPRQIVPIYDTAYNNKLVELLYHYPITRIVGTSERVLTMVEWWTAEGVTKYLMNEQNVYVRQGDPSVTPGHFTEFVKHYPDPNNTELVEMKEEQRSWGRLPIVEIRRNRAMSSLLRRIKSQQDAINLLSSKVTNDEISLVALYWVLKGYGGEAASVIQKKIQMNRGVSIPDQDGDISAEQIDLPTEKRIVVLDWMKKDMYDLAEGILPDIVRSGNVNSVELKMRFERLNNRANRLVRRIKVGLIEIIRFYVDHISEKTGQHYDARFVRFDFHYSRITSDTETINSLQTSRGMISQKTILRTHPYVDDPEQEAEDFEAEQARALEQKAKAYDIPRNNDAAARIPKPNGAPLST